MEIRKATIKDCRNISRLIQQNITYNPNNYTPAQLLAWKKYNTPKRITQQLTHKTIFCAFIHHKLVATIAIKNNELSGFYVRFSKRNLGIGSKLFNFVINFAKEQHIEKLKLVATPSAVEFYKKKGFILRQKVVTTFFGIDYDEFKMEKSLL